MPGSDTLAGPRPLVLVVEDQATSLQTRLELFRRAGCAAIGVRSSDDAVRELGATPQVNLLVTDIHLSPRQDVDDRSGIVLAQYVREMRPGLPIAGYSAHFADNALSQEELAVFDRSFGRGAQTRRELAATIEQCKSLALRHRETRQHQAEEKLENLRRSHERHLPDVDILRNLALGSEGSTDVEDALLEAGYRLRLVEAGVDEAVVEPFIVWLIDNANGVDAEVYGQPVLYANGEDEREALDTLVELMLLFLDDLSEADDLGGPAASLRSFLRRVFHGERG